MNKNYIFGIGIVLAMLVVLTAPAAADAEVWFSNPNDPNVPGEPLNANVAPGENVTIQIMWYVDTNESGAKLFQVGVDFDRSVVNITNVTNPIKVPGWGPYPPIYWWDDVHQYRYVDNDTYDNDIDPPLGAYVWLIGANDDCHEAPITVPIANLTIEGVSGGTTALNFTHEIRRDPTVALSQLFDCAGDDILEDNLSWYNSEIECTGGAPTDWNLTLNGAITDVINRSEFEDGVACHNVSWTDWKNRTWTGIPLWRLLGWVDDDVQHNFNDTLADKGYDVTVTAGDGYSKTFNSTFVKRNDGIFVANELNGTAIPEGSSSWPLRLTGSALKKWENVKNVVEINITFLPDLEITEKSEEWVNATHYNVTYMVKNNGTAEACASTISIEIDGAEVATDPVPGLAVDASHTATLGPFTMSGDNDTILVCADRDNAVGESDEENNCLENEFMGRQPDLIIEDIRPIRCCCYYIESIEKEVLFIDDPELAKELGDEELRKEVAEALAKDPKLAKEIAVKLAGDDKKAAKELSNPELIAERCCCRCNAMKELAGLLGDGIDYEQQQEMSELLYEVRGGCCGCCCGRLIAYKIANVDEGGAGWSLSKLTVDGRVRSVDIVRPLDAGQSRWEIFPCYRMWWWPWHHEVTVCADDTDRIAESNETNNCRTENYPSYVAQHRDQH